MPLSSLSMSAQSKVSNLPCPIQNSGSVQGKGRINLEESLPCHRKSLHIRNLALGHVAICDLVDEGRVGVEEHDVEVLDGVNRLEGGPVLEPRDLQR